MSQPTIEQEMLDTLKWVAAYLRANYPVNSGKHCKAKDLYEKVTDVVNRATASQVVVSK